MVYRHQYRGRGSIISSVGLYYFVFGDITTKRILTPPHRRVAETTSRVFVPGYDYFYMDALTGLVVSGVVWGRTIIGLMIRPYETFRRIVDRGRLGELWYVGALSTAYFALASVVKVASFSPFLLSRQFVVLSLGAVSSYAVAVAALLIAGYAIKAKMKLSALAIAWGYTLIPTVIWFFMTSLLYVILPPPRTTSIMGIAFSVLFLVVSATLLWWKVMLAYLTVRFVMKIDLPRILAVCVIFVPIVAAYSTLMYRWGIFKVPFL